MIVPMYALAVAGGVAAAMYSLNLDQAAIQRDLLDERRVASVDKTAEAIRFFYDVNGRFPVSLVELGLSPGGEFVRDIPDNILNYAVANGVDDGSYVFNRAVVFTDRPRVGGVDNLARDLLPAERLTALENNCGAQEFALAPEFCFPEGEVVFWMDDTRHDLVDFLREVRLNLRETLKDFAIGFIHGGEMPKEWPNGTVMTAGDSAPLEDVFGLAGGPGSCTGSYTFEVTLLDCEDIHDPTTGSPITYLYEGPLRMTLIVDSGIFNAATGENILIAQSLDVPPGS